MFRRKSLTTCYEWPEDSQQSPGNIIERVRKLKALNGLPRQVGLPQDALKEFTVLRLKAGY